MPKVTKKLVLDLDELVVESFETASGAAASGTVRGYNSDVWWNCGGNPTAWPQCQPSIETCPSDNGCMNTYGCDTAYCVQSQQLACPTATCHDGCTADCPGYPAQTWNQTCPATCDWACASGGGSACAT